MEHGAHLGILGDNPFLILAFIFLLGFLIIARFAALPARGTDLAAEDGLSVAGGHAPKLITHVETTAAPTADGEVTPRVHRAPPRNCAHLFHRACGAAACGARATGVARTHPGHVRTCCH